jgi:hypothetical protein
MSAVRLRVGARALARSASDRRRSGSCQGPWRCLVSGGPSGSLPSTTVNHRRSQSPRQYPFDEHLGPNCRPATSTATTPQFIRGDPLPPSDDCNPSKIVDDIHLGTQSTNIGKTLVVAHGNVWSVYIDTWIRDYELGYQECIYAHVDEYHTSTTCSVVDRLASNLP